MNRPMRMEKFFNPVRWLRSNFRSGGLILLYHRVDTPDVYPLDPFQLRVDPKNFAQHLEAIRKIGNPVSLEEMTLRLSLGESLEGLIAVTFDDGYFDNLEHAGPILESYQVPATFFIVTGSLGKPFWWDDLAKVLINARTLPSRLRLPIGGRILQWNARARDQASSLKLYFRLYRELTRLPSEERESLITEIAAWAGAEPKSESGPRVMTAEELSRLSACCLFEIGGHTASHPKLANLPLAQQEEEIRGSKFFLEQLLSASVKSFSYPFGQKSSYSSLTAQLVRQAGYTRSCASTTDIVSQDSDVFQLPRYPVSNWSGEIFTKRIGRWLSH